MVRDIKRLRESAGLKQTELLEGNPFGITVPILSIIENGLVLPSESFFDWCASKCGQNPEKPATGQNRPLISENTRRESNEKIDRAKFYREIIATMGKGSFTAREVGIRLGFGDNARQAVAPRLTELVKLGAVEVTGRKKDWMTGKNVSVYRRKDVQV